MGRASLSFLPMSANETKVCNLALAKIGGKTIMSLDDQSPEARICRRMFEPARDEVLRSHRWNFATKRATLSRLSDPPAFGWSVQYQLPVDCLRVLQVNGYEELQREGVWEVEGGRLMTDQDRADVKYIARITDSSLFDAIFVKALAIKIASEIAMPLTGSKSLPGELLTEYRQITGPDAMLADATEGRPKRKLPWVESDFVAARFGRP